MKGSNVGFCSYYSFPSIWKCVVSSSLLSEGRLAASPREIQPHFFSAFDSFGGSGIGVIDLCWPR